MRVDRLVVVHRRDFAGQHIPDADGKAGRHVDVSVPDCCPGLGHHFAQIRSRHFLNAIKKVAGQFLGLCQRRFNSRVTQILRIILQIPAGLRRKQFLQQVQIPGSELGGGFQVVECFLLGRHSGQEASVLRDCIERRRVVRSKFQSLLQFGVSIVTGLLHVVAQQLRRLKSVPSSHQDVRIGFVRITPQNLFNGVFRLLKKLRILVGIRFDAFRLELQQPRDGQILPGQPLVRNELRQFLEGLLGFFQVGVFNPGDAQVSQFDHAFQIGSARLQIEERCDRRGHDGQHEDQAPCFSTGSRSRLILTHAVSLTCLEFASGKAPLR